MTFTQFTDWAPMGTILRSPARQKKVSTFALVAVTVFSLAVTLSGPGLALATDNSDNVRICHKNNGSGWSSVTADDSGVDGITPPNGDHNMASHQGGQDIIPPFYVNGSPGYWTPRNWDAAGQEIFENDCNLQAQLTVIKHVVGGPLDAEDFTLHVAGTDVSPATFPGNEAGTLVSLDGAGGSGASYDVSEDSVPNYTTAYSKYCSANDTPNDGEKMSWGEVRTCTVTNTYVPYCGDNVINQESEQCDGSAPEGYSCTQQCTLELLPFCGDNVVNQESEQCDGSAPEGFSCTQQCTLEQFPPDPFCGDQIVNNDEQCDGSAPEGYTCSNQCTLVQNPYCGDNTINQESEQCDGSAPEGYSCTQQCTLEALPFCGDNVVNQESEQCDGSAPEGFSCTQQCTLQENPPSPTYSIFGKKFQQIGEELQGLGNWVIDLFNNDEEQIGTDTTDESGSYSFDGLNAGNYSVCEEQQSGWTLIFPDGNGCHNITLPGDTENGSVEANFINQFNPPQQPPTHSISGYKWNDLNGNGEWEEGEPGLDGWTITLGDNSTVTGENGYYTFGNLQDGEYTVCEQEQNGWTETYPDGCHSVVLDGEDAQSMNFGNHQNEDFSPPPSPPPPPPSGGGGSPQLPPPQVTMTIAKSVAETFTNPGGTLNYTIVVTNTGNSTALNVVLTDTLPAGFTYAAPLSGTTNTWNLGDMLPGANQTIAYQVIVGTGVIAGTYVNIASVNASNFTTITDDANIQVRAGEVLGFTELPKTGGPNPAMGMFVTVFAAMIALAAVGYDSRRRRQALKRLSFRIERI